MASTFPEPGLRLAGISPRAYQHPADRAATAALGAIPKLDLVVRKLIELGYERALRQAFLGSSVRLGEQQLAPVWALHRQVVQALDLPEVPALYLTAFPLANAMTIGAQRPIVVLNSELVTLLDADGRRVVLAHEAAHIHSDHVLYRTALTILLAMGQRMRLPLVAGLPLMAVQAALLEWSRAVELSCDRAAALVTGQPLQVCRTLMTIAGGAATDELSLDAFMAQGMDYEEGGKGLERLARLFSDLNLTHPMPVRRTHELMRWVRTGEYDRILGGEYPRRGEEPPPRAEAGAAADHYGERVRRAFEDAVNSINEAGDQVADVRRRVDDWLGGRRGEG
ncbi:MAG TPA: M48 family metallopeptidase [Solirubrobacteraceae bacterium]|nr:M48 family metallopeptidase [Solirubrobacteraceae bacterium]